MNQRLKKRSKKGQPDKKGEKAKPSDAKSPAHDPDGNATDWLDKVRPEDIVVVDPPYS